MTELILKLRETVPGLVKFSICLEPDEHNWAEARAQKLYGRRGIARFIRKLIREDKARVTLEMGREI